MKPILLAFGTLLIAIAVLADWLGLSNPANIGIGQIVAFLAGVTMMLIATVVDSPRAMALKSATRSLSAPYRSLSMLITNTLVLLVVCELAAVALNYRQARQPDPRASLPYYKSQAWSVDYWRNHARAFQRARYESFVIWRTPPFASATINIDERGIRRTSGADCAQNSFQVFAFGGSTMLGYGAPDSETIPSYLQDKLKGRSSRPVCVTNFGDRGWVSTQSVIMLLQQLRVGHVPDLILFYDGFNDVIVPYQTGQAGTHGDLQSIRTQLEHPVIGSVLDSAFVTFLLPKVRRMISRPRRAADDLSLSADIVKTYLSNYRTVEALAAEYRFRYLFFLQPIISLGNKPFTADEMSMKTELEYTSPGYDRLVAAVYSMAETEGRAYRNLAFLTSLFDSERSTVWIDSSHITPVGNRIVAEAMVHALDSLGANPLPLEKQQ